MRNSKQVTDLETGNQSHLCWFEKKHIRQYVYLYVYIIRIVLRHVNICNNQMYSRFLPWIFVFFECLRFYFPPTTVIDCRICRHGLRLRTFNFGLEGFSRLASRRYHVSKKEKKEKEKAGEKPEENREDEYGIAIFSFFFFF